MHSQQNDEENKVKHTDCAKQTTVPKVVTLSFFSLNTVPNLGYTGNGGPCFENQKRACISFHIGIEKS